MKNELYRLSIQQTNIMDLEELVGRSSLNNIASVLKISEMFKWRAAEAIEKFIENCPTMRLCMDKDWRKYGSYRQFVRESVSYSPQTESFDSYDDPEFKKLVDNFTNEPLDVYERLFDFVIVEFADGSGAVLSKTHHVISDAYAHYLVVKYIFDCYNLIKEGKEPEKWPVSYLEYLDSEKNYLESQKYIEDSEYWRAVIEKGFSPASLSRVPAAGTRRTYRFESELTDSEQTALMRLATELDTSPYVIMLSLVGAYTARFMRTQRIALGTAVGGRATLKDKKTMGMYVATIPTVVDAADEKSFAEVVKDVTAESRISYYHYRYPYKEIQAMARDNDMADNLFDIFVSYQNLHLDNLDVVWCSPDRSQYPLSVHLTDYYGNFHIILDYQEGLYNENSARLIKDALCSMLVKASENSEIKIADLPVLGRDEMNKVCSFETAIDNKDDSKWDYKDVWTAFLEQADATPGKIAVTADKKSFSYDEIRQQAANIAGFLAAKGVKKGSVVALKLSRTEKIFAAQLGVLSIGAAYLPIDPDYPKERIDYILEDSGAGFMLDDMTAEKAISEKSDVPKKTEIAEKDPCYVIYTSGSTGKPKGTVITQGNVYNYCRKHSRNVYGHVFDSKDTTVLSVTTISFDIFVTESLLPLTNGMSILLADEEQSSVQEKLDALIKTHRADVIQTTPSKLSLLTSDEKNTGFLQQFKKIILGGEPMDPALLSRVKKLTDADIYNIYGPTETTVWSSITDPLRIDHVTIGRPIAGTMIYILDEKKRRMPIGATGALYIGGKGVCAGYHKRDELTKEKFTPNPYGEGLIYETGDYACWNQDGELEFLGRADGQIKLHGLRIELGEIENSISEYPGVTASAVVMRGTGQRAMLCGFFTASEKADIDKMRSFLLGRLTDYMVPAVLMQLDEMPYTNNGKLDRKRLPEVTRQEKIVEPSTEEEKALIQEISEIIKADWIGMTTDLFTAGMTSLNAIRLSAVLENKHGIHVTARDILSARTPERILNTCKSKKTNLEKRDYPVYSKISSAQMGMYLDYVSEPESLRYNIPVLYRFDKDIDVEKLADAFGKVIMLHPAFFLTFEEKNGGVYAHYHQENEPEVSVTNKPLTYESFVKPFDLHKGPLYRIVICDGQDDVLLFFDVHHIVFDGASAERFMDNVCRVYEGREPVSEKQSLADLTIEEENLVAAGKEENDAFFRKMFEGTDGPTSLKPDVIAHKMPEDKKGNKGEFIVEKSEEFEESVKKASESCSVSPMNFMLSAFSLALSRFTGDYDIIISFVEDGRESAQSRDTVGMFVKTLPIRIKIDDDINFNELSHKVGESVYDSMSHDGYTVLDYSRDYGVSPSICFVYQNSDFADVEIGRFKGEVLSMGTDQAKYDLSVSVEGERILAEYRNDKFSKKSVEALLKMFICAAKVFAEDPGLVVRRIELITEEDSAAYSSLNDTDESYNEEQTVLDLFKKSVSENQKKPAIVTPTKKLTYEELDLLSDRMAAGIAKRGIGKGDFVGVCLERSEKSVAAELAILKSGAAFLPMDTDWPLARKDDIAKDCGMKLVIDEAVYDELASSEDSLNKALAPAPEDPCYVIYTSGSTGKPKGSVISHKNLVNFCLPLKHNPHITEMIKRSKVMLSITNPAFDASLHDIMGSLLNGMTLALADEATVDSPSRLAGFIKETKSDCMVPTPSRLLEYLKDEDFAKAASGFRLMIVAAEAFPAELSEWKDAQPDLEMFNGYGPSECTIGTSYSRIESGKDIFIGKPIANTHVLILDKDGNRLPVNVPGEICIGGRNVGGGYLSRPKLNAEKFTIDPFGYGKLYHTGDIGILDEAGELRFSGRIDDQVKINGQRVELAETEEVMKTYPGVTEAVVVVAGENSNVLVGYYTADKLVEDKKFRAYLAERLTSYMVPVKLIRLEKIPVTPNGKRDTRKLCSMYTPSEEKFVAAETDRQKKIASIICNLLGVDNISFAADLKGYGLNSLKAVMLNENICKEFGVELSSKDILFCNSAGDIEELIEKAGAGKRSSQLAKNKKDEAHLTMSQTSVWYETQLHPGDLMYHIPVFFEFDENVDAEKLEKALIDTVNAHKVLLATLGTSDEGKPVIRRAGKDAKAIVEHGTDSKKTRAEFVRPFDEDGGALMRMAILNKKKGVVLALDFHHIIFDGESQHIFLQDLKKCYEGEQLSTEAFDIFDYSLFEEKNRNKNKHKEDRDYIKEMFSRDDFAYSIPADACYGGDDGKGGATSILKLPEELRYDIASMARAWNVTEGSIVLSAFALVLSKYERTRSLGLAVVEDGRIMRELDGCIGMFVRTLPLAIMLDADGTFGDNAKKIQRDLYNTISHGGFALAEAATEFDIRPRIAFTYNNYEREVLTLGKGKGTFVDPGLPENSSAKFDITLSVAGSELYAEYDRALFNEDNIKGLLGAVKQCLINAVSTADKKLRDIELISPEEKALVAVWNDADEPYDKEATIVSLFESAADKNENKLAVAGGGIEYTYAELEKKANSVANALLAKRINIGDIVALKLSRTANFVCAALGVLKAGAAYLPMDKAYPQDRIDYILEDCNAALLLDDENLGEYLDYSDDHRPNINLSQKDLCYVIYTSGSTGKPKGILTEHGGVINYCMPYKHNPPIVKDWEAGTACMGIASFTFDMSTAEIYPFLFAGKTTVIASESECNDPRELAVLVNKYHLDCTVTTPSRLMQYFKEPEFEKAMKGFVSVSVGGEAVPYSFVEKIRTLTKADLYNVYGPTEITMCCSSLEINKDYSNIGTPFANFKLHVLDEFGNVLPIGVPGELCVSGRAITRGYLNRPELTAEKFVNLPIAEGKVYRTGDLSCWNRRGEMEYLGRIDDQVKLRGQRMELGEIEQIMSLYPGIEMAAAAVQKRGENQYLIGFYSGKKEVDVEELRRYMLKQLTHFMVPDHFVHLSEMPLSINGKIDRKRLPQADIKSERKESYQAPETELEGIFCSIFKQVLNLDEVGVNDDFFENGGNSLNSIDLIARANREGIRLTAAVVAENSTPGKLARYVEENRKDEVAIQAEQGILSGTVEFGPIQKWFFENHFADEDHFNQAVLLEMENPDTAKISRALNYLIERHDALRLKLSKGELVFAKPEDCRVEVTTRRSGKKDIETICQEEQIKLSLSNGQVVGLCLIDRKYLLITIHHMAVDIVSWRILLGEFDEILSGLNEGRNIGELAIAKREKTSSVRDFANAIKEYAVSIPDDTVRKWNKILKAPSALPLAAGEWKPCEMQKAKHHIIRLSKKNTKLILEEGQKTTGLKENEIVLGAIVRALRHIDDSKAFRVHLEDHGRDQFNPAISLESTVGWFTSLYPVSVPYGDAGLLSCAYDAAKAIRTAPDGGRSYGALKYLTDRITGNDTPSVTFNYGGGSTQSKTVNFKVSDIIPSGTISPINHVTDAVSVNASVADGALSLVVDIDPSAFEVRDVETAFVKELENALSDFASFFGQEISYYPLLAAQTGIYLAYLASPESLNYNEAVELTVKGKADAAKLRDAIVKAVLAHPSMMTNFTEIEGRIVQFINTKNVPEVPLMELTKDKYEAFRKDFVRPFNLANGPLYRIAVVRLEDEIRILIDFHHIIYDRTSSAVFMEDIRRAYENGAVDTEEYTCALAAVEEERVRDTARYEADKLFFMNQFEEGYDKAMISKDRSEPGPSVAAKITRKMAKKAHSKVQSRAKELGITDNAIYYAAFNYALGIWSGQESVISGFVSTGRDSEKYASSVGMFVKTLPANISIDGKLQIGPFLKGVHKHIMETMSHDMYAYSDLVALLDGTDILSVLFAYQNTKTADLVWEDVTIGVEILDTPDVKFDLTFMAVPGPSGVELDVEYDAAAYDEDTIENFIRTYMHILDQLSGDSLEKTLHELSVTDDFQHEQLEKCNSYTREFRRDVSVSQLIREQAKKLGDKEAYVFKDVHLSFKQFNMLADRGAGYLVNKGVAENKVVAILLKRSEKFTLAMLSTVRAGGAYLPLAVDYPADRLSFLLKDTGTSYALISKTDFRDDIEWPEGLELLYVEDMFDESLPAEEVEVKCDPNAPFCLLHTSGSTGTPKCAMLSRINQSHFMQIHDEHVKGLDWGIALTTVTFDAFAMDNFMLLCNGIRVYLPTEEETLDQHLMDKVFTEHKNSFLFITPTRLVEMFENTTLEHMLENIGLLFFGGEAIRNDFVERIRRNAPHSRIMQVYGPTETTIVVTGVDQLPGQEHSMGVPFANSKIYILDKQGRQVPLGAVGEIFIGGENVGLGYRNRPELTAERFLPDPFIGDGRTMYRTGDLAKRLQDGRIIFIGRIDTQIKFHGQRMEIAEVENCISSFGSITGSAVVVRKHERESFLCAFYTSTEEVDEDELRAYVSGKLVYYMVPSTFTRMDELPHTAGGKMNYRALPEVEFVIQINPCETKMQEDLAQMAAGLLSSDSIGRDTNLLSLGMTSLSAIRMNTLIFDKYGVHLKTKDILANPTVEGLESILLSLMETPAEETKEKLTSKDGTYPLSSAQMGVLLDCEKDPDGILYNIPMLYRFPAGIDAEKLRDALYAALDAHPYMNTGFVDGPEGVRQIPHERTGEIEILKLSPLKMKEYLKNFVRPFDLYDPPLWRLTLIISKDVLYMCLDIHHIIFDGESLAIFMSDVMKAYKGEELVKEEHDSFELALIEENNDKSGSYEESKEYVANMLSVIDGPSEIPGFHPYGKDPEPAETLRVEIPQETDEAVRKLAARWNVTRNHIYTAAFCLMVGKYTYSEEIGICVLSSARDDADFAGNIGMMVKTLPFAIKFEGTEPVEDLVHRVSKQNIELMGHGAYPYAQMVSDFKMQFEIMFSYQNHDESELTFDGSYVRVSSLVESSAKFPLLFDLAGRFLKIDYDAVKYDKEYVRQMGRNFIEVVSSIIFNEKARIKEIRMLPMAQKNLLDKFNETYDRFDTTQTLVSLFDDQCAKTPKAPCVWSDNRSYNYEQTQRITNCIANKLISKGVKSGDVVAVRMERSDRLVFAIWGILKAGAAMQPIDMDYPKDRVDYVLDDSEARFVITEETIGRRNELLWDNEWLMTSEKDGKDTKDPGAQLTADNVAYVIYTSGSTGLPKGVMITHKSIVNYSLPLSHNPFTSAEIELVKRTLSTTTVAFDVFCSEIFSSMPFGIEFYMATDEEVENAALLAKLINEHDLQCMHVTPSKLLQYMEDAGFCKSMEHLKVMMVAGEPFPTDLAGRIQKHSDVEIYNGYGPTEATVITGFARITGEHVTIGKPLPNSQVRITDRYLNELPVGVVGELCATGFNVGKGYIKRPELNAKVYVDNPFGEGKLYRTGDLARWDEDGNIECLGRIDTQVKLNGLRIEPGEIEAAIRDYEGITASAVIVSDQGGHKVLVAYYTAEGEVDENKLMESLAGRMVYYMVPRIYCRLDNMPKTLSGKIDRKALPKVEMNISRDYTAPETPLQKILCEVFEEVLGVDRVGINDSFFDLGGDSIKGIQVTGRLFAKGYKLRMRQLFDTPTVKEIEPYVSSAGNAEDGHDEEGQSELTPIQKYFFSKSFAGRNNWNQSVTFEFRKKVTKEQLKEIFDAVVMAHDVMHATFNEEKGLMEVRKISETKPYLFECCKEDDFENAKERVSKGFDIKNGPLVGLVMCSRGKETTVFVAMHHLICDGVTWRIIAEDLNSAMASLTKDKKILLPASTSSYRAWAETVADYGKKGIVRREAPYWSSVYEKGSGTLPFAEKEGGRCEQDLTSHDFELDRETTQFITGKANELYGTGINDILLTALARAVFVRFGLERTIVNLEGHGREDIGANVDISRTVGWFTITYPILLTGKGDLGDLIAINKEAARGIPEHGISHDILRFSEAGSGIGFRTPEITFNYLGEIGGEKGSDEGIVSIADFGSRYDIAPDSSVEEKIRITGVVMDGKMRFSVACCEEELEAEKAERLTREYKKQLEKIADLLREEKERIYTPSDLGWEGLSLDYYETILEKTCLKPSEIEYVCPLSPVQQGMLSLAQMFPDQSYYFEQTVIELRDKKVVDEIVRRMEVVEESYDVLRASMVACGKNDAYMVVRKLPKTNYEEHDLTNVPKDKQEETIRAYAENDRKRGFDYEKEPLFRASAYKLSKNKYALLLSFSHIILDKWSTDMLFARMLSPDFDDTAKGHKEGRFINYIRWIRKQDMDEGIIHFKKLFEGCSTPATLPAKKGIPSGEEGYDTYRIAITEDKAREIEKLARREKVTLGCVILYLWGELLCKQADTDDAVFGYTMSGRTDTIPGIEQMAGNFINTLPVRISRNDGQDIGETLRNIQEQVSETEKYAYLPIGEIQKASGAKFRLLEHFLTYQNTPDAVGNDQTAKELFSYNRSVQGLSVSAGRVRDDGIILFVQYDKRTYAEEDIKEIERLLLQNSEEIS